MQRKAPRDVRELKVGYKAEAWVVKKIAKELDIATWMKQTLIEDSTCISVVESAVNINATPCQKEME